MRAPAAIVFGVVLAVALTPVAVVSGPFEDGANAASIGDFKTALRLWQPLAEQGLAIAQSNLGAMYRDGLGVPQDYAEAIKWVRLAAEQGHAQAQNTLGRMYGLGQGVPEDLVQAHMWFNLAAARLPPGEDRDRAVELRDVTAEVMTPAQIAEAQRLAREWRPRTE